MWFFIVWHDRYAAPTWCGIVECYCAFHSYSEYVFLGGGLHFVHYFCLSELISHLHPPKQGKTANSIGQTLKCQSPTLKSHYFLSSCTFFFHVAFPCIIILIWGPPLGHRRQISKVQFSNQFLVTQKKKCFLLHWD